MTADAIRQSQSDVRAQPERVEQNSWKDYALRFVFGGVITAIAGIIAHAFGPLVGGLFLAFPAILPASITLIQQHDDRHQAGISAEGATLGTIGLMAFGLVIWAMKTQPAALNLLAASLAWAVVSIGLWFVLLRNREA